MFVQAHALSRYKSIYSELETDSNPPLQALFSFKSQLIPDYLEIKINQRLPHKIKFISNYLEVSNGWFLSLSDFSAIIPIEHSLIIINFTGVTYQKIYIGALHKFLIAFFGFCKRLRTHIGLTAPHVFQR